MRTWIELSAGAFYHNITQISSLLPSSTNIGLVVKSNAYGHGMVPLAQLAEKDERIGWLCTAGIEEALSLRHAGITKPIVAMAYHDASLALAIENKIAITVYDRISACTVMQAARLLGQQAIVHIKVDTGLGRLGIGQSDVSAIIDYFSVDQHVYIQGIFTHLADTNNVDLTYTNRQLSLFDQIVTDLKQRGITISCVHVLSSGALILSSYAYDMVRVGTNAYGFWKSRVQEHRFRTQAETFNLKPVLSWFSSIQSIARTGSTTTACVPIGYTDGYPKALEGKASALVNNQQARIVGVFDDHMVLDVHGLFLDVGSCVVVMGGFENTSVTYLAGCAGMLNNEIATGINPYIPRIVVI